MLVGAFWEAGGGELGAPVGVIATSAPGYLGLNVFGLVSGAIVYAGPTHAQLEINVKGLT